MKIKLVIFLLAFASVASASTNLNEVLLKLADIGSPPTQPFNLELFERVIDEGANVNSQDVSGKTPLTYLAESISSLPATDPESFKLMEGIAFLLDRGARVSPRKTQPVHSWPIDPSRPRH